MKLRKRTYGDITESKNNLKASDKCPICFIDIGEKNYVITDCNHKFCLTCFLKCMEKKSKCPICRNEIYKLNQEINLKEEEYNMIFNQINNQFVLYIRNLVLNLYNILLTTINSSIHLNTCEELRLEFLRFCRSPKFMIIYKINIRNFLYINLRNFSYNTYDSLIYFMNNRN